MDYLVGIDLGSTNLKAVIYDRRGNVSRRGSRPTERFNPYPEHPEWTIWKPEQIWGGERGRAARRSPRSTIPARSRRGGDRHGHGRPADRAQRQLALSVHQLALPADRAAVRVVAEAHRRRAEFSIGGNPIWLFSHRAAAAVDGGARAGDSDRTAQVAADRGLRQLHALRPLRHRLQHGLQHAAVRPAQAGLVGRNAGAVGHRPPAVVRCPAQRHGAGRGARRRRPRRPGLPRARRSCWAATIICAAHCRGAPSARAWCST